MFSWFDTKTAVAVLDRVRGSRALRNLVVTVASDIGNLRTNNEDAVSVFVPRDPAPLSKKGYLLLLADGMGGHNSGEVASEMTLDTFSKAYYGSKGTILKSLKQALNVANKTVYDASVSNAAFRGMGTTCTAMVLKGNQLFLAHVGDSRAYYFSDEIATQLTKDQTLVQQRIDTQQIKPEEAATHPDRNVLTNALGAKPFIEGEIKKLPMLWTEPVSLLLCSDGLYEYVGQEEMASLLSQEKNIETVAGTLIERAKARGGHDNISVIIASFNGNIHSRTGKDTDPG